MLRFPYLVAAIAVAGLVAAGCGQAAPQPTKAPAAPAPTAAPAKPAESTKAPAAPTTAPAVPTKAAAPAPTAAPAAAPAKKVDFPQKGKPITLIVPFDAGGGTDIHGRLLAAAMEKDLGVPVQVLNKPGGGAMVGTTELVRAKPDGYTIMISNLPTTIILYLDPEKKAAFGRKDFEPVAFQAMDSTGIEVREDSPYKTLKDLIDAAKAAPEKIRMADGGFMTTNHLATLMLERAAGVKFAQVHQDSGAANNTAVLGGHVEAAMQSVANLPSLLKDRKIRVLAILDEKESDFFPGVKTAAQQGYPVYLFLTRGVAAPGGTPREVVDLLSASIKKASADEALQKKMAELYLTPRYMDAAQFTKYWDDMEGQLKPLLESLRKQQ